MKNIVDHIHTVCDSEIHGIEFDNALFYIQQSLGVESGDVAGNVFSNYNNGEWTSMTFNERIRVVKDYIIMEIDNRTDV